MRRRRSIGPAATAAVIVVLGNAAPGMALGDGHSGSVVFAESLGDAAKRVDGDRMAAPRAHVDIASVQFTQTDGLLTVSVQLRSLRASTVDRLAVNLDTDDDALPDVGLQWPGADGLPAVNELDGFRTPVAPIECLRVEVRVEPDLDRLVIELGRSCLSAHAGVRSLQLAVRDRMDQVNGRGELVQGKWDFLGGPATMVAIPF